MSDVTERLPADCRLAANLLQVENKFETGQAILREAADEIEALRAKLAAVHAIANALSWHRSTREISGMLHEALRGEPDAK